MPSATALPAALRRSSTAAPRSSRTLIAVLLGLTIAVTGCSSSAGEDPVTVTRVVSSGPGSAPPASPRPTTSTPADPTTADPEPSTDAPSRGDTSEDTTSDTSTSQDTSTETSTSDSSSEAGDPPSSPAAGAPTANAPDASPDAAGPETGPACATDSQYVDEQPTGLRSDVIAGWRAIEKAANADGVIVCLNDGKRSKAQQQAQYDQYAEQYGKEVADQLVLPPSKSAHVIGNAIDVQPQAAYQWLQATKGSLGFCRIYDNEPWHFEYDVAYFDQGCPARLPKPQR